MKQNSRQTGSALFVILIAVALFAALAYAFTQGSRTNQSQLTDHQMKMIAQEIISYGNTLADTVQKLKLRGCQDNQYSFYNTVWTYQNGTPIHSNTHNPASVSECRVFDAGGGKLSALDFEQAAYTWSPVGGQPALGTGMIITTNIPGLGNDAQAELLIRIPYVKEEVCKKINDILGIPNPAGNLPVIGSNSPSAMNTYYNGVYADGVSFSDAGKSITGKTMFCVNHHSGPQYNSFIVALLIR